VDNLTINSRGDLLALVLTTSILLGMETVMDVLVSSLVHIGIANLLDRFGTCWGIGCNLFDLNRTTEVQGDLQRPSLLAVAFIGLDTTLINMPLHSMEPGDRSIASIGIDRNQFGCSCP
jgi:hypothetical protein